MTCIYLHSSLQWVTFCSSNLSFNTKKFIHLSFNTKFPTSYNINDSPIMSSNTHCDVGIILSTDLSWKNHNHHIFSKAHRTLGLLRCTFSHSFNTTTKRTLYIALVRSQLLYCSPLSLPYPRYISLLLKECSAEPPNAFSMIMFLIIQLAPSNSTYYHDILFFIKSIQNPSDHFNIWTFIKFCHHSTGLLPVTCFYVI